MPRPDPEVLGFAQSGEVGGGAWTGDLRLDLLTTIAYFGVNVAADGSLITSDYGWQVWQSSSVTDLINAAHSAGDRVVLTVKQFDTSTISSIIGTETNRQNCISAIVNQLASRGGDGVNVDFEGYDSSTASNFTTFIGELQYALRSRLPSQSFLTVDTYGSSAQGGTMFDIGGLSPYVDAFDVMAYDLTSPNSAYAGPVAPMNGYSYTVTGIVSSYLKLVAPAQVILGVPYYGYKWSTVSNAPQAATTSAGVADTYSAALSDFSCAQQLSLNFDSTFYEPWASWYSPASGDPCGGNHNSWRELYYENAQALGAKYDLVNGQGLRGIGIWALGYDSGHSDLWNEIAAKFTVTHFGALAGVVGTDGALYDKLDASQFGYLGGRLLAAPAVVSVPNSAGLPNPLYIGVGTDHRLYVRSNGANWQDLVPGGAVGCVDSPAAVVTPGPGGGQALTVACEGGDQGLYYWQAPVSAANLPAITGGYHPLGGVLFAGPAVAAIPNGSGGATITFFAETYGRAIYSRTLTTGYTSVPAACIGHPAVASTSSRAYFACQGTDGALWYSSDTGGGWAGFASAGGQLIDGPGVAVTSSGVTIYVEGSNQALFHTAVGLSGTGISGYVYDGGAINYGVGATGLR